MIQFSCGCGRRLKVNKEFAGRKIKCPECAAILRVPEAADGEDEVRTVPSSPPVTSPKRQPAGEEGPRQGERPRRRRAETDEEAGLAENRAARADLRRRVSRANKWCYFLLFLMPLGFIIPCSVGMVLGKSTPDPQGFTVAQAFGIAALALPLGALGGWFLMAGDRAALKASLAVAEQADRLGYRFSATPPGDLMTQLNSFRMFEDADYHFGLNHVLGTCKGKRFSLMEYRTAYRASPDPYGVKVNIQTVVIVHGLERDLPDFRVGPRTWLSKLLSSFEAPTSKLPGHPDFNRKFIVCGDERDGVEQVFNPEVVQLILEADATVEVYRDSMLFYRHNSLLEPANYQKMIKLAVRLATAIGR